MPAKKNSVYGHALVSPRYERQLQNMPFEAPYYRLPQTGPVNDGIRVDKDASKWGLKRQPDGSILISGKTIRFKVWAGQYCEPAEIYRQVESVNPKWDYNVARELGYWFPATVPQWRNVEVTSVIEFLKSARKDPFVGIVVRSCIHDNATDKELKGRPKACQAGSSYHSNIHADHIEEKGEALHVKYFKMAKANFIKKIPKINNILNKKIGFKFCLYNSEKDGQPIVKSESYYDWDMTGNYELTWAGFYTGKEKKSPGLISWGSPYIILKSNATTYKLHDLEIKEIATPPIVNA